jgi:hypothetical protein
MASLDILSSTLCLTPGAAIFRQEGFRVCLPPSRYGGAARTMKLFRTAFWLGVVIYNLPSPASQPAPPESQLGGSQSLAAKAASRFCPQPRESCPKNAEALPNRGGRGGHSSSRDAAMPSHDTLTPTDRAVPWRPAAYPATGGSNRRIFPNAGRET